MRYFSQNTQSNEHKCPHKMQVFGGGTGDEELLLHLLSAAQAPLWLLSKPWLQQGEQVHAKCFARKQPCNSLISLH
jgi:hypothetical protein